MEKNFYKIADRNNNLGTETAFTVLDIEKNKDSFKFYGGDMRKLYQKAKEFYSLRLMKESIYLNNDNKILIRDDFNKSLDYFKNDNKDNKYEFSMYT